MQVLYRSPLRAIFSTILTEKNRFVDVSGGGELIKGWNSQKTFHL